jgi:hypothetical protein
MSAYLKTKTLPFAVLSVIAKNKNMQDLVPYYPVAVPAKEKVCWATTMYLLVLMTVINIGEVFLG